MGLGCTPSKTSYRTPASSRADTTFLNGGAARRPGSVTNNGRRTPVSSRAAGSRRVAPRPKMIRVGKENVVISSNMSAPASRSSTIDGGNPAGSHILAAHFENIDEGERRHHATQRFCSELVRWHHQHETNKQGVDERDAVQCRTPPPQAPLRHRGPIRSAQA